MAVKKVKRRSHLRRRYKGKTLKTPIVVRGTEYIIRRRRKRRIGSGSLARYGYSLRKPARERREALLDALEKEGIIKVLGRLESLRLLHAHNPAYAQKVSLDIRWLEKRQRSCD